MEVVVRTPARTRGPRQRRLSPLPHPASGGTLDPVGPPDQRDRI